MKMDTQVNSMCKSAWFHLYTIGKIRSYLSVDQTKSVVHAYVTPKLDGNNALLVGPRREYLIDKLQLVQNATAKIITKSRKFDHVGSYKPKREGLRHDPLSLCDRRVHCDTMSPLPEHCSISQCVIMFPFASTAGLQYFK